MSFSSSGILLGEILSVGLRSVGGGGLFDRHTRCDQISLGGECGVSLRIFAGGSRDIDMSVLG